MNNNQVNDLFKDNNCYFCFEPNTCLSDEFYKHCKMSCNLKEKLQNMKKELQ